MKLPWGGRKGSRGGDSDVSPIHPPEEPVTASDYYYDHDGATGHEISKKKTRFAFTVKGRKKASLDEDRMLYPEVHDSRKPRSESANIY